MSDAGQAGLRNGACVMMLLAMTGHWRKVSLL
jgi:hypothetical protein